ncbi:hypothetical protein Taro_015447 [Colocasia esculenta]|uniref:Uncharacterized protein n=1 Tax=Colocasia esculenta TaxID=4460 RepID=A0A843UHD7_COLES|nr:hypothetical protein [Colocasia esculenta]
MVRGGRSGRGSASSGAPSTFVGRGSTPIGSTSRLTTPVVPATGFTSPTTLVRLSDYAGCPGDRVRHSPSSVTCPIPFSSRGKIDPGPASRYITSLLHAHAPGPVDSWKEFPLSVRDLLFDMFTRRYMFTRPEDLPRARVVWESTAQTNFRKSMWEAWDKAAKTTSSQDPTAWMDYGPVWMRRGY